MASRKPGTTSGSTPDEPRPTSQEWVAPDEDSQQGASRRGGKKAASPATPRTPPPASPRARKTAAGDAPATTGAPAKDVAAASKAGALKKVARVKPATAKAPAEAKPATAAGPAPGVITTPAKTATPVKRTAVTRRGLVGNEAGAAPAVEGEAEIAATPAPKTRVRKPAGAGRVAAAGSALAVPERPTANLPSFPSLLPERDDPVRDVVGGAGDPRGVAPAGSSPAGGERSGLWLPLAMILAVAALLIGVLLIGSAVLSSVNKNSQLPGSPGFSAWPVVALVVVLAAAAWGLRAYANRHSETDPEKRSRGWRWLFDTRVIGSLIAVLLVLVAFVLPSSTPGYSPDIRAIPGEVSGLLQQAVAQKEQGYPRIRISSVNVDLLLVKGDGKTPPVKYEAFTYPMADHLLADKTPGNTYVYAHARTGMFWELHNLNIGNTIEIDYGGGKISRYRVSEIHKSVNWKDFSWLQPTNDDRLTLQTCNGFRDEDPRFIVVARKVPDTKTALAR